MSTAGDDMDPLAGIDLEAWQPPAPPSDQVDAIMARITDATRADGAAPVEVDMPVASVRPQRAKWIALGFIAGAAAATVITLAMTSVQYDKRPPAQPQIVVPAAGTGAGSATRTVEPPVPTVGPPVPTIAQSLATCRRLRDEEQWAKLLGCANDVLERVPDDPDFKALAEQARREAKNKIALDDLRVAAKSADYEVVIKSYKSIPSDSVYFEKARREHDQARDRYIDGQVAWAKSRVAAADCEAVTRRKKQMWWPEAEAALEPFTCEQSNPDLRNLPVCDADALLAEARLAGSSNQWSKVLTKAEAANKCSPSKEARRFALLAACNLGNRDKALKYWKEFEQNTGMQQKCIGIVK